MITMQADQQLSNQLDLLQRELADMKEEMTKMQERFNKLTTETKENIETGNKAVIDGVDAKTKTELGIFQKSLYGYIDQKTNPVRQNAPAVGAFLILSGCFLLWASKQYKLTGGARKNG